MPTLRHTEHFLNSCRSQKCLNTIIIHDKDNLYTSVELAKHLQRKKMTLVGTMRQNKKGVSQELIEDIKERPAKTTIVWFEEGGDMTLSLYKVLTKSRGDHVVIVLSTYQGLETLGVTKDDGHRKSAMFKFYDFTKDSYQEM